MQRDFVEESEERRERRPDRVKIRAGGFGEGKGLGRVAREGTGECRAGCVLACVR